jgi:hypothetical protein
MALDFSTLVYLPNYDTFARPITITPLASQPGAPAYTARGIFGTRALDVGAMDGSIISDQQTIMDIREAEFTVLPEQLDRIFIEADPAAGATGDELGEYEIVDAQTNGGGETTLVIRKVRTAQPS